MHMIEFTRAMVLTTGTIQSTRTQLENSKLVANISYLSSRNSSGSQKASGHQYQSHKSVPSSVPFFNNVHQHQQMRQIKTPMWSPSASKYQCYEHTVPPANPLAWVFSPTMQFNLLKFKLLAGWYKPNLLPTQNGLCSMQKEILRFHSWPTHDSLSHGTHSR